MLNYQNQKKKSTITLFKLKAKLHSYKKEHFKEKSFYVLKVYKGAKTNPNMEVFQIICWNEKLCFEILELIEKQGVKRFELKFYIKLNKSNFNSLLLYSIQEWKSLAKKQAEKDAIFIEENIFKKNIEPNTEF